jgi:hypothetical protein
MPDSLHRIPFAQRFQQLWKSGIGNHEGGRCRGISVTPERYHTSRGRTRRRDPAEGPSFDSRGPPPVTFSVCPAGRPVWAPRPMGFTDEEDVPAEQPSTEAHPRLPRPHADEGRPARPEAAPPEGPEADRRLRRRRERAGACASLPAIVSGPGPSSMPRSSVARASTVACSSWWRLPTATASTVSAWR